MDHTDHFILHIRNIYTEELGLNWDHDLETDIISIIELMKARINHEIIQEVERLLLEIIN